MSLTSIAYVKIALFCFKNLKNAQFTPSWSIDPYRGPRRAPTAEVPAEPPSSVTGSPRGPCKRRREPASPRRGFWKRRPRHVAGPPLDECVAVERDAILRRPSAATQNASGVCVVDWRGILIPKCTIPKLFWIWVRIWVCVGVSLTNIFF